MARPSALRERGTRGQDAATIPVREIALSGCGRSTRGLPRSTSSTGTGNGTGTGTGTTAAEIGSGAPGVDPT